jgi:uncharacterized protein
MNNTPVKLIEQLSMTPHPRGGHYAETYRATDGSASLIFYLLQEGECQHWHRLVKDEILHFYDGDPMRIQVSPDGRAVEEVVLGRGIASGEHLHYVVPKGTWFSLRPCGAWVLTGCSISPAFAFDDVELAEKDWSPGS